MLTEFIRTAPLHGTNGEELHRSWAGTFEPTGLFHQAAGTYDDTYRGIRCDELRELDRESGTGVFNSFAEILRRNVVSDKNNAFNKIFNLFLCKIADEDQRTGTEEMEFQWRVGDDFDSFIARLTALYETGVRDYLNVTVAPGRHWPLGEFSFLDVYDEPTYDENGQVLREIVELLQPYKVKYSSRHQHLGDFFEMLLNTGVKQEAGQYFTPVPLVDGILHSLPLREIVDRKIAARSLDVLPLVLDYACGAGHFLTQAIEHVQSIVETINPHDLRGQQRSNFTAGARDLVWAKDYIYGIERDYRLAKVTKVATFLNGDGLANIARADGLGDFASEQGYQGRLRTNQPSVTNSVFDVVVANPPYAVPNFATTLRDPSGRFRLFKYLTSESGEIECLFLERAGQVLRSGGVAGILFPLSILNNGRAIYQGARRLLAMQFELIGMIELRDHTFMATSTTTVCMFLKRRTAEDVQAALRLLVDLDSAPETVELLDSAGVPVDLLRREIAALSSGSSLEDAAYDSDLIAHSVRVIADSGRFTVLAFAGEGVKPQERFLGYRFSRSRGSEGLHTIENGGVIQTALFNPSDLDDERTVSAHIRGNFDHQVRAVPEAASGYLKIVDSASLWRSSDWTVTNPSAEFVVNADVRSHSPFGDFIDNLPSKVVPLGKWLDDSRFALVRGAVYQKSEEVPTVTGVPVLTASNVDLSTRRLVLDEYRFLREGTKLTESKKPRVGDIVICSASGSLRHLGKIAVAEADVDAYIGGFLMIFRPTSEAVRKVLEYNLLSRRFREFIAGSKEQNISNLTGAKLRAFPLTVPDDLDAFVQEVARREALTV